MDERRLKSLLVFEKETFIGLITIGDIQRAIIANIELTSTLSKILEKSKKIYAKEGQSIESIKKTMLSFRAECMPVLNDEGKLVSVYYWEDFFDIDKKGRFTKNKFTYCNYGWWLWNKIKTID